MLRSAYCGPALASFPPRPVLDGITYNENLHVQLVYEVVVAEYEDPLDEDDRPRVDALRFLLPRVGAEAVQRDVDRLAALQGPNMIHQQLRFQGLQKRYF